MIKNKVNQRSIVRSETSSLEKPFDIQGLIQDFLDAQDILPISKEIYRKGIERFLTWKKENGIINPTRSDLLRFKGDLKEMGLSVNSCNSYLTHTKRFFSYLHSEHNFTDITKAIAGYKQARGHLREALTESQVTELQSKIDISTIQGKRDLAVLTLLADTGLRICSIVRLDLADLKQIEKEGKLFYKGKGHVEKDLFVILREETLKMIMFYLKARGKVRPEDPLFISHSDRNHGARLSTRTISRIVKNLLIESKFDDPRLSAHSLRHFFATNSLKHGADLLAVSRAMGHASVTTTQIYLHEADRMGKGAAERFVSYERREINLNA